MSTYDHYDAYTYGSTPSGETPADDSDLRSNPNPMSQGSPGVEARDDTTHGYGSDVPGYYTNPPTSLSGNPYAQGSADQYPDGNTTIAGGFDNLYSGILSDRQPTYDTSGPDLGYAVDQGIDDQTVPQDERR